MKKTVSVLILLAVINNCAKASNFEDGLQDGQDFCELEWSGDLEDCWGIEDLCEAVIDDEFTIEKGDSPSEKSYKRGGRNGVKMAIREIEKDCFHDDVSTCNTLGEDAAEEIADAFCPNPKGARINKHPDYKEVCRIKAVDICKGKRFTYRCIGAQA